MEKKNIRIFQSVKELAAYSMEWMSLKMKEATKDKFFTVALSGGTTPKQLFEYLAMHGQGTVDWTKILFFWSDERCVAPDNADSNYHMAKFCLLDKLEIPEEHIFRIHGEAEPIEEAKRYSLILEENVPLRNGLPCFDLILLGLGEDGHTASIFPGNTHLFESARYCESVKHPQTGQQRVTLTGSVINNADNVVFLVTGSGKAEIVSRVLNTAKNDYPASLVSPVHGRIKWFLDQNAASRLI